MARKTCELKTKQRIDCLYQSLNDQSILTPVGFFVTLNVTEILQDILNAPYFVFEFRADLGCASVQYF